MPSRSDNTEKAIETSKEPQEKKEEKPELKKANGTEEPENSTGDTTGDLFDQKTEEQKSEKQKT